MTISRLMWIAIFSIISHPLEVSDVLTDVILGDGADMTTAVTLDVDFLSDMEIVVMATPAIALEFVVLLVMVLLVALEPMMLLVIMLLLAFMVVLCLVLMLMLATVLALLTVVL